MQKINAGHMAIEALSEEITDLSTEGLIDGFGENLFSINQAGFVVQILLHVDKELKTPKDSDQSGHEALGSTQEETWLQFDACSV